MRNLSAGKSFRVRVAPRYPCLVTGYGFLYKTINLLSNLILIFLHYHSKLCHFLQKQNRLNLTQYLTLLKGSKGPGVAQWLRSCATSRTYPGLIPGGVTGFFSDTFPSDQTMALGSTQPLVKMSTRNIPGGKGGWCVRLITYHHIVPMFMKSRSLSSPRPLWACMACNGRALPLPLREVKYLNTFHITDVTFCCTE